MCSSNSYTSTDPAKLHSTPRNHQTIKTPHYILYSINLYFDWSGCHAGPFHWKRPTDDYFFPPASRELRSFHCWIQLNRMLEIRFIPHQLSPSCVQTPWNCGPCMSALKAFFSPVRFSSILLICRFGSMSKRAAICTRQIKVASSWPVWTEQPVRSRTAAWVCIEGERRLAPPGGRFWNTCLGVDLQKRQ